MLNKKFYLFFIILSVLLFSTKKSKGGIAISSKYTVHSNFLKKPNQSSKQGQLDCLIDIDDRDDETAKTRYKPGRASASFTLKFNPCEQNTFNNFYHLADFDPAKEYGREALPFSKTSLHISIRCLRI